MGMKVQPTIADVKKENKGGVLKITEEFADSTAIHAIPHIFKTTNRVFKCLWILITVASFGKCIEEFLFHMYVTPKEEQYIGIVKFNLISPVTIPDEILKHSKVLFSLLTSSAK